MKTKITIILGVLFLVIPSLMNSQSETWKEKVEDQLLEENPRDGIYDFLIIMNEQAEVSKARYLKTKSQKGKYVFGELKDVAERTQIRVIQKLINAQVEYHPLHVVNLVHAKGDINLIRDIAILPEVNSIISNPSVELDYPVEEYHVNFRDPEILEWGVDTINANDVWDLGYTGEGVVVGGQDTGYEWYHPALFDKYRGYDAELDTAFHDYNWHDAIHEINPLHGDTVITETTNPCGLDATIPCDDHNHGTHTMGIMVGKDGDNLIGAAPGAKWIGCRNMDRGYGTPFTYLECFQWFLAPTDLNNENPDPEKAPHVINNSWHCPEMEGCTPATFNVLQNAVSNLRLAGVVVVVSAGNQGSGGCSTIASPPNMFEESFAVGATGSNDSLAGFSSRGPVLIDGSGRLKPNVTAPGVLVYSSIRDSSYASFSGTSMSGPFTAGLVALIISANPDLAGDVDMIEMIIEQTALPKTDTIECGGLPSSEVPNHLYGWGRINALAAVEMALDLINNEEDLQLVKQEVNVFPNPTNDVLNFEINHLKGLTQFELYDANGRLILSQNWNLLEFDLKTVSLRHFSNGVYFYRIINEKNVLKGKLLKS